MTRRIPVFLALVLVAGLFAAVPASAHEESSALFKAALAQMEDPELVKSDNMRFVTNLPYELKDPENEPLSHGTDIEFYTVDLGAPPGTGPGGEGPGGEAPVTGVNLERLEGDSRIADAVAVSKNVFESSETIVLARVDDYADALAGTSLAADRNVPLLLSNRDELPAETAAEIQRLGATKAILLGLTDALTEAVEEDLREIGAEPSRIGGANRFGTAALIMDELPATDEVLIAEGDNADEQRGWPDAISAATLGAFDSRPILLALEFELPTETADKLSSDVDATILGGPVAINEEVEADIDERAAEVTRIEGQDRYATNALAAREAINRGVDPSTTYVATGDNYADGLVAGAAAGAQNNLMVLVDGQNIDNSPQTLQVIADHADAIETVFIVGNTDVITAATEQRIREAAGQQQNSGDGTEGSGDTGGSDGDGSGSEEEPETDDTPVDNNDPENVEAPRAEGQVADRQFGLRDFAAAGSYFNGMQIIDITDPEHPEIASVYDCGVLQGDVQILERDGRTYATYTSEDTSSIVTDSRCVQEAVARGDFALEDKNGNGEIDGSAEKEPAWGTYIVDITDPYAPAGAGFIPVVEGSHNGSVHPSGDYFYNSDSVLINEPGKIQVYDIRDFDNIERVADLPLPTFPGLGTSSHDITFNADGTRGYSAALSQNVILDTTDPANPTILEIFRDPAIETEHQTNLMTLTDSEGNKRDILVSEDELIGAIEGNFCPGGGMHFYDVTGDKEQDPLANKIGAFFIPEERPVGPAIPLTGIDIIEDEFGESGTCTAHVFRLHPDEGIMTVAWYNAGTRVVDISGLADAGTSLVGMPAKECGFARFDNSDTWSTKTNEIAEDGSFYLYSNDIIRGLDVFHYTPDGTCEAGGAEDGSMGVWMTPEEALAHAQAQEWPGAE